MLVMRPARSGDVDGVLALAKASPVGVTSLPDDRSRLAERIAASEAAMASEVNYAGEESYFFVLEDEQSGELLGCSGIVAAVGVSEPFYSFRNETFVHASRALGISHKVHALSLCHDLTGHSLLHGFYLKPELLAAQPQLAELVSRARLLFMASHPERFAEAVVVEIVGYSDSEGNSPFWDHVGRHFLDVSYAEAERLCGVKSRTFLAELMPHYPLYVPLLDEAAQQVMGEVHPESQITFDVLMREGFDTDRYIDIFDGGPTLTARTSSIRSIAHSHLLPAQVGEVAGRTRPCLVAHGRREAFRAIVAAADPLSGQALAISPQQALLLGVAQGAPVRVVAL